MDADREMVGKTLMARPISLPSLQEEVYKRLRTAIQEGVLRADTTTGLRQLAENLGVSTMPVREAVRRLEAEGLLSFSRRDGIRVTSLSAAEFSVIVEMRIRLETLAIVRAIPQVTPGLIIDLRTRIAEMDATREPSEWLTLNYQFHRSILVCADSPRLFSMIEALWVSMEPYLRRYAHGFDVANAEHRDLVDAIERSDSTAAEQAVIAHIRRVERLLLSAVSANTEAIRDRSLAPRVDNG